MEFRLVQKRSNGRHYKHLQALIRTYLQRLSMGGSLLPRAAARKIQGGSGKLPEASGNDPPGTTYSRVPFAAPLLSVSNSGLQTPSELQSGRNELSIVT